MNSDRKPDCGCKYCSKRPQSEISKLLVGWEQSSAVGKGKGRRGPRRGLEPETEIRVKDYTKLNTGGGVSQVHWT